MSKVDTTTVHVGSHTSLINVGGAMIPIGFMASFRKKNHLQCESGRGFVVMMVKGNKSNAVCPCAAGRAVKKFKQVGPEVFAKLGTEWLEAEKIRLAADEERCRKEGYEAAAEAKCPYPNLTDQFLAWQEGRARREEESKALVPGS